LYSVEKEKEIKSLSVKDAVEYFVGRDLRLHMLKPEELNALTYWKARHYGFLEIVLHHKSQQHER
jgi:hypothetical protein